jgi:hypothetical protein
MKKSLKAVIVFTKGKDQTVNLDNCVGNVYKYCCQFVDESRHDEIIGILDPKTKKWID